MIFQVYSVRRSQVTANVNVGQNFVISAAVVLRWPVQFNSREQFF